MPRKSDDELKPNQKYPLKKVLDNWPIAITHIPTDQNILDLIDRLQNLLNVGMVYAFVFDHTKGSVIFVSKYIKEITGYSRRYFKKKFFDLSEFIHPQDLPRLTCQLRECGTILTRLKAKERKNHTFTFNYRLKKADGKYMLILHEFFVMTQDDEGRIKCTFNFCKELNSNDPRLNHELMINPAIPWQKNDNPAFKLKLSDREKELLSLLADGHKTVEISKKLYLSPHTISTHRKRLLRKFNQKNTASLVIFARENDLI